MAYAITAGVIVVTTAVITILVARRQSQRRARRLTCLELEALTIHPSEVFSGFQAIVHLDFGYGAEIWVSRDTSPKINEAEELLVDSLLLIPRPDRRTLRTLCQRLGKDLQYMMVVRHAAETPGSQAVR